MKKVDRAPVRKRPKAAGVATRHRALFEIPANRTDDPMRSAKARADAFAMIAAAMAPQVPYHVMWRRVSEIVTVNGKKIRQIGYEVMVSREPFTDAEIASFDTPIPTEDAPPDVSGDEIDLTGL